MADPLPFPVPPHVPAVEPELLASAIFLFSEYLERLAAESPPTDEEADADAADAAIDTRAVLDLFAEELGTRVQETLALYLRVTALYRLLAASPSLAGLAIDSEDPAGRISETALLAAARLDLHLARQGAEGSADFDPRQFREALGVG